MSGLRIPAVYMRGGTSKGVFFLAGTPLPHATLSCALECANMERIACGVRGPWQTDLTDNPSVTRAL